jgi:hypothetical protein
MDQFWNTLSCKSNFWEFVFLILQFDDAVDAHGSLPESLDIGDVSEPVMPADSASSKQKNATAGASTSSHHLWIDFQMWMVNWFATHNWFWLDINSVKPGKFYFRWRRFTCRFIDCIVLSRVLFCLIWSEMFSFWWVGYASHNCAAFNCMNLKASENKVGQTS